MSKYDQNMGCLFGLFAKLFGLGKKRPQEAASDPEVKPEIIPEDKNVSYNSSYQKKYLFTKNEWYAHKRLVELAKEKNLVICPKVRLLDIIEPRSGEKNYMSLMGKIQSKHVDFVICDSSMRILGVVELDDNSHKLKDRQDRDEFVNEILTSVGYKVVHTYGIQDHTLDCFTEDNKE